jgi:hypothetical protein
MRMKNKIKKRLLKVNGFLKSKKKPGLTVIHLLRLEIKHLEAFLELMSFQKDFGASSAIPNRLDELFQRAGNLRKFGLEIKAVESITHKNAFPKPELLLNQLKFAKKKAVLTLIEKRSLSSSFNLREFLKHTEAKLSFLTVKQFLFDKATLILDLIRRDISSDIKSLHQLRKLLKSIIYVLPICQHPAEPVVVFLKSNKDLIKTVESEIGSLHDTDSFVTGLGKKHRKIDLSEEPLLNKIKQEWQNDIGRMQKDLQTILPSIRQFAVGLKDQSTDSLNNVRQMYN